MIASLIERAAINLLIELENTIRDGITPPCNVILAMNKLKQVTETPAAQELKRIYNFTKLSTRTCIYVKPKLYLIKSVSNNADGKE